ncbi:unnamed protein product [Linum trigynum]|uniref:Serpin domain-containing protein n=1 Tax=Linum trigynum TaxID=586398 RepID=A0AAV2DWG0_9ROSI
MRTWERIYDYAYFDEFKVLKLIYQSWESKGSPLFSMYFFLPHKADGLSEMLDQPLFRGSEALSQTLGGLEEVRLKRFGSQVEVRPEVPAQGDDGEAGACIAVDEDGTEAAVVSAFDPRCRASPYSPPKEELIADHPFVFMIVESKSQVVLFARVVFNP